MQRETAPAEAGAVRLCGKVTAAIEWVVIMVHLR